MRAVLVLCLFLLSSFFQTLNATTFVTDSDAGYEPGIGGCVREDSSDVSCHLGTIILRDHCVYQSGKWLLKEYYFVNGGCEDKTMVDLSPSTIDCNDYCVYNGYSRGSCVMVNNMACGSGSANRVGQCGCKIDTP